MNAQKYGLFLWETIRKDSVVSASGATGRRSGVQSVTVRIEQLLRGDGLITVTIPLEPNIFCLEFQRLTVCLLVRVVAYFFPQVTTNAWGIYVSKYRRILV